MKKLLSVVIIGIMVLGGLGTIATGAYQPAKKTYTNNTVGTTYVDELDQSMIDYDGSLPLGPTNFLGFYANLSVAQSFIPQKELLTRTQFLMARNASTSSPCVLAVRDNLTGENLAIISVTPGEFPVVNGTPTEDQLAWINFNFDDIWVIPGQTYYLVVYTANITENYYWISGNGTNMYPNGSVMLSIDDGKTWGELIPNADGCFKTYGLRETFLGITMNSNFFGPSFVIKNIGNYSAWDLTWNYTTSGGFLLFKKDVTGSISELLPGNEIIVKSGFIFGFGKVTLSLKVSAANVKELSIQKDAIVLLFFVKII
ncbi:MAG: hypothetical protein IMZ43_08160 [Thermoplasmata archaeon]|nr:hypothetical protein [Thermoplasmata archaeon]MBE3137344.1 hypothetical protein [Thermoplasmata archaeon]MBE3139714.1 hypothetical protein [Thermoplasmata archaeon]